MRDYPKGWASRPPRQAWRVGGPVRMLHTDKESVPPGGGLMPELAPIAANNPWLHPLMPTQPPSLSERLIRALEAHASSEAHDLAVCQELAERSHDPVVRLLVGLVVEDEQR